MQRAALIMGACGVPVDITVETPWEAKWNKTSLPIERCCTLSGISRQPHVYPSALGDWYAILHTTMTMLAFELSLCTAYTLSVTTFWQCITRQHHPAFANIVPRFPRRLSITAWRVEITQHYSLERTILRLSRVNEKNWLRPRLVIPWALMCQSHCVSASQFELRDILIASWKLILDRKKSVCKTCWWSLLDPVSELKQKSSAHTKMTVRTAIANRKASLTKYLLHI